MDSHSSHNDTDHSTDDDTYKRGNPDGSSNSELELDLSDTISDTDPDSTKEHDARSFSYEYYQFLSFKTLLKL